MVRKRKFVEVSNANASESFPSNFGHKLKHPKIGDLNGQLTNSILNSMAMIPISEMPWLASAGCRWSEVNWSCAYDSVFMSLYEVYATIGFHFHEDFCAASPTANMLGHSFQTLLDSSSCTPAMFDQYRDKLRDELSSKNPDQFPCFGHHGASVYDILNVLFPSSGRQLIIVPYCPN